MEKRVDNNNDGTIDNRTGYTLDANGHVLVEKNDYTNDGAWDRTVTYELDASGNVLKAEFDNDNSGSIDRTEFYTLDTYGYKEKVEIDTNSDGKIDSNVTYIRDIQGNAIEEKSDSNNDGTIDDVTYKVFDIYGNNVEVRIDTQNDGSINRVETYEYNHTGQWNKILLDTNGDGTYEYKNTREFDASGLATKESSYDYSTDTLRYFNLYQYNGKDAQPSKVLMHNSAGELTAIFEYTYEPIWGFRDTISRFDATGNPVESDKLYYDNVGELAYSLVDMGINGSIENLIFGYGGNYRDHHEDFTKWTTDKLNDIKGLANIVLSDATAESIVTLDRMTIANISPTGNRLAIYGDATDTVNLNGGGFTKQADTVTAGGQVYDKYTTDVDGTTYTVLVDNDINTVLG